eukprot:7389502-Prymnesium_polylepis.3
MPRTKALNASMEPMPLSITPSRRCRSRSMKHLARLASNTAKALMMSFNWSSWDCVCEAGAPPWPMGRKVIRESSPPMNTNVKISMTHHRRSTYDDPAMTRSRLQPARKTGRQARLAEMLV